MPRLPIPGQDDGIWGDILNGFLDVAHNPDGTLIPSAVSTAGAYTKPGSGIPATDLDSTTQTKLTEAATAVQSVNGKTGNSVTLAASDVSAVPTSEVGQASGVASLDGAGNVPTTQLANVPANVHYRGAWAANTAYAVNDAVLDNGGLYVCTTAHTSGSSFSGTDWTELSAPNGTYVQPKTPGSDGATLPTVLVPPGTGNITTDTAAVQSALNDGAGGTVAFSPFSGYSVGQVIVKPGTKVFLMGATITAPSGAMTDSWWKGQASVVHQGTAILGPGTLDASAITSMGGTEKAVLEFASVTSCPNLRIEDVRVINAPVHGIFVSEGTATVAKKWIARNSIEGHAGGYGIYADYIGSVEIDSNYVTDPGVGDDAIELGHSGPANLGVNAHLRATNNTCVNGQLQFPFSDYAEIIGNTTLGNTIQNDDNTANYVTIVDNTVLNATPGVGYSGINVSGTGAVIANNNVTVTTGSGVGAVSQALSGATITGNVVTTTSASASGSGIQPGGTNTTDGNIVANNQVNGRFQQGIGIANSNTICKDNILNVAGAAYGFYFNASTDTGYLMSGNVAEGNIILGSPTTLIRVGVNSWPTLRNNVPYNPVGLVTVTVPTSGTATTAAPYDQTFYITASTSAVACAVTNAAGTSQTVATIPASGFGAVFVPARSTLTPTYTAAPTWTVQGN